MAWRLDWRKPVFGTAAVLVQLALIAALFQLGRNEAPSRATREIETLLFLTPAPKPAPLALRAKAVNPPRAAAPAMLYAIPKAWQTPPQQTAKGLNALLFDCAPENLANLTPEELARCKAAAGHQLYDPNAVDFADHTNRAVYAALWANQKARKNAPTLLPCFLPGGVNFVYTAYCAANIAINGFYPDQQPSYGDKHEVPPKPIIEDHGHLYNPASD